MFRSDTLVFNQVWEDASIDREALSLGPSDTLLSIASAGDNVLALCSEKPKTVYAVDVNYAQIHLMEFKLAAIRNLTYEDFWHLFCLAPAHRGGQLYREKIRDSLTTSSRRYWDTRQDVWRRGLGGCGLLGHTLAVLRTGLRALCGRHAIESLFETGCLESQSAHYAEHIHRKWWNSATTPLASSWVLLLAFGLHPHQVRRVRDSGFALHLPARILNLMGTMPVQRNHFWQQVLLGRYLIPPEYAKPSTFEALKSASAAVRLHRCDAKGLMDSLPAGHVTRFNLLDSQDWLGTSELVALWWSIDRVAAPGARVLYRSLDPGFVLPSRAADG